MLWEENSQSQRSIASITKVMTATVFLEKQSRSRRAGHRRAQRRVPGVDDAPAGERPRDDRRSAAPAADRVGQRRRPRAGARVAARLRRVHRAHEREGRRTRAREHALRGPVRPAVGERVVGLRHGAAHHATRRGDERIASIMRTPEYTVYTRPPADHVPQHQPPARARRRRCARGQDRLHFEVGLLPGDAASSAARASQQVAVVVLGARSNAGRFMETQNLFNWLSSQGGDGRVRHRARPAHCSRPP